MSEADPVVILGGGIIGLSIAYDLSQEPSNKRQIYIIDAAPELFESPSICLGEFLA
jgi:glycine/D-amino acid oxidase-like deaminating enzyme